VERRRRPDDWQCPLGADCTKIDQLQERITVLSGQLEAEVSRLANEIAELRREGSEPVRAMIGWTQNKFLAALLVALMVGGFAALWRRLGEIPPAEVVQANTEYRKRSEQLDADYLTFKASTSEQLKQLQGIATETNMMVRELLKERHK
jgi:hypothetical protein